MAKSQPKIYTYYDDEESLVRSYVRIHAPQIEKTKDQIIRGYWNSMNNRIKKGIYAEKNIQVIWTYEEFKEWFNSRWNIFDKIKELGEIPSIDRIDSNGHYIATNCRMIPMSVNAALGEVNSIISRMKTLQEYLKKNEHWLKAN